MASRAAASRGHERYDAIGDRYARYRRPDARIARQIERALEAAPTILNVGSGTGSYEPRRPGVVAVEPSVTMIEQRPPDAAPVLRAVAEHLPFADGSFDTALALLTVHHWSDFAKGCAELRRVAPRQVVLTWDAAVFARYWFVDEYFPELAEWESTLPTLRHVESMLDVRTVEVVPVPPDCTDGFCGAYWRRPESYLDPGVRGAISGFSMVGADVVDRIIGALSRDLADGTWARRHGDLLERDELDAGYRLVIAGEPLAEAADRAP